MSFDISITERRDYIAEYVFCEGETPPVGVRAEINRLLGSDQTIQAAVSPFQYVDIVIWYAGFGTNSGRQTSDYRYGTTISLSRFGPQYRISLERLSNGLQRAVLTGIPPNGLPAVVSGDTIRLIFPEEYFRNKVAFGSGLFEYRLYAGYGLLLKGYITAGPFPTEEEDAPDDPDSQFSVCQFTVT